MWRRCDGEHQTFNMLCRNHRSWLWWVAVLALRELRRPAQRRGGGIGRAPRTWPALRCLLRRQTESRRNSVHHLGLIASFLQSTPYLQTIPIMFPGHMTRGGEVVELGSSLIWAGARSQESEARSWPRAVDSWLPVSASVEPRLGSRTSTSQEAAAAVEKPWKKLR